MRKPPAKSAFPYLWNMDDKERANLNKAQADRDAIYIDRGVLSQEESRKRLAMDRYSGYNDIDVDDVPEPQQQPLENTDKEEQDEEDRQAMDEWVESDHPRDDDGKFSQKSEKLFIGHKLALEDLKKQAQKESSVLGVVKKLKENNDIAQYGEFAKGRESSVVWYWYNGGRKTQPTKEDVDSLVEENYKGYGDYKTYEELPDDVRYKFTSNDLTEDSSIWSKVKGLFAVDKKKGNPYRQERGRFGYAPLEELKLQKEEYARIIGGIREKTTRLPDDDVFSSYTSFNFKYLFWLNKETNDVIIYAKIKNEGEK